MQTWFRFRSASLQLEVLLLGCSRDPNVAKQKPWRAVLEPLQLVSAQSDGIQVSDRERNFTRS